MKYGKYDNTQPEKLYTKFITYFEKVYAMNDLPYVYQKIMWMHDEINLYRRFILDAIKTYRHHKKVSDLNASELEYLRQDIRGFYHAYRLLHKQMEQFKQENLSQLSL
jgi:hypothetical protein